MYVISTKITLNCISECMPHLEDTLEEFCQSFANVFRNWKQLYGDNIICRMCCRNMWKFHSISEIEKIFLCPFHFFNSLLSDHSVQWWTMKVTETANAGLASRKKNRSGLPRPRGGPQHPHACALTGLNMRNPNAVVVWCNADVTFSMQYLHPM